jgi:integrase
MPQYKRRVLAQIQYYPRPQQIFKMLVDREGWPYKTESKREFYHARDRALCALLYLGCLRISEAIRIRKSQFETRDSHILIQAIELSKTKVKGKRRRIQFRDAKLPLKGEREPLTRLVMKHVDVLGDKDRLFPWSLERNKENQIVGCTRGWQICNHLLPEFTEHWLRAFGEDYLYDAWDHDILAVSDYVKIDPRTLQEYLRKRHEKYPTV